jgi:hypothetical protein
VDYAREGAEFDGFLESQFLFAPFPGQTEVEVRADNVMKVKFNGAIEIVFYEPQVRKNGNEGARMYGYGMEIERLHGFPAWGVLLWMEHVFDPPRSPYRRALSDGKITLSYNFDSLELGDRTVAEVCRDHRIGRGFLPLLLLCKDGADRYLFNDIFVRLFAARKPSALKALIFYATKVFKGESDLAFIEERLNNMREVHDPSVSEWLAENDFFARAVREDVEAIILAEGKAEGLAKGKAEGLAEGEARGLAEGEARGLAESIELIVQVKYPALAELVHQRVQGKYMPEKLKSIQVALLAANTAEEARDYLNSLS